MIKKFLILLCSFAFFIGQSQEPLAIHLSEDEGLLDKVVFRVIEDKEGLIWLATNSGLYSFDGENHKAYRHPKQIRSAVFGLQFDQKGRLWFNNMGGEFYYVEQGEVHFFMDLKEHIGARLVTFNIVDNTIILNSYEGFYKVNINTKAVKKINLKGKNISIHHNINTKNYCYQDSILYEIKSDSAAVLFKTQLTEKLERPTEFINYKNQNYIVFETKSINSFFKIDESGIEIIDDLNAISRISISYSKQIKDSYWFFTVNGAYEYQYIENKLVLKNHYLKGKRTTDLIIDRNKNYIFSTLNDGLYIVPDITVKEYKNKNTKESVISHFMAVNDNVINYISNNNKLHTVNFTTEHDVYRNIEYFKEQFIYYDKQEDRGLFFNGVSLEIYNPYTLKTSRSLYKQTPKDIKRLNDSAFVYTLYGKTTILDNNLNERILHSGRAEKIAVTKSGHYYVNTAQGLKWGKAGTTSFENILLKGKKLFMKEFVSKKGTDSVWVSRPNWGIYLLKDGKVLKQFYESENGLLDKNVRAMASDDENLWIATNKGVQKYNYKTEKFTNFSISDGIIHPRILKLQVTDNYIWYQTSSGIYQFPKTKQKKDVCVPEIYFSEIRIGNVPQEIAKTYAIDYNANALDINFMANGLNILDEYQFEYKIEGLNSEWITLELGKHQVSFNSLPSRKYTVNVRAKNILEGNYTDTIQFKANVTEPFWKRWWFSAWIAIIGVIGVYIFFKIKAKRKEKQKEKELEQIQIKHQLVALKLENLRSQMNPHFIFNALNSIQEYIILNQKKLASDYLGKFADLMRTYLRHSSKGNITLQEEIDCLEMYLELEKLRFEDKLTYSINTKVLDPNTISIPTMLIQPYVENALKHGLLHRKDNRILKIDFYLNKESKTIKCSVIDNGIGRVKAEEYKARSHKQHSSFATKANQDRLHLLNYGKEKQIGVTIIDLLDDNIAKGTQVDIVIPYENI